MAVEKSYQDNLRHFRSLLIVTSLQKRQDIRAAEFIQAFPDPLDWSQRDQLMIAEEAWEYVVETRDYAPQLTFCHPDLLTAHPQTSLYYRGLCGMSIKTAKGYVGAIENLELGNPRSRLSPAKARKMAQTYNTFISSIIINSTGWTLENGRRTLIATLGITLDGTMRNKIGSLAEERIRTMLLNWLIERDLVISPKLTSQEPFDELPSHFTLTNEIEMTFQSEPDVAFRRDGDLLAVIEIKGGIDPAGALERYGAATKSFQHAVNARSRCRNYYLAAVVTPELDTRIRNDRLVDHTFNIIDLLEKPSVREEFLTELFHHTLRLV